MIPGKTLSASLTAEPIYIEDVFSTYLYSGNSSTQSINNGIDLSTEGGMVWIKVRTAAANHFLFDTVRGTTKSINSNTTSAQATSVDSLTAFNTNGFSLGAAAIDVNDSGSTYASWTFRQAEKFFDVVTYTGNGANNRQIAHNLGSVPGFIIVKNITNAQSWICYHRSLGTGNFVRLDATSANSVDANAFPDVTSTYFVPTADQTNFTLNTTGDTFVVYLFAHNAGGFGLSGTDNVVSCGSFTTDGSGNATVSLGYEPQWVLIKQTDGVDSWYLNDNMRGMTVSGNQPNLSPNSSAAESAGGYNTYPNATGFTASVGIASKNYIYIAIRRGPMKQPTVGTSVFTPLVTAPTSGVFESNILTDSYWTNSAVSSSSYRNWIYDRLRGNDKILTTCENQIQVDGNAAEATYNASNSAFQRNEDFAGDAGFTNGDYAGWAFKRAPGFFDTVCYTGTGVNRTVNHNLGVVPELMIVKSRGGNGTSTYGWIVYAAPLGPTQYVRITSTSGASANSTFWNDTAPTSTVFTVGTYGGVNNNAINYVAYLFATIPGVSKVGSYTGTGTTLQINCGFTSGARFVLIKRTSGTGGAWYVWDSARGIVSGNDPYLLLNSSAAQVTNTDYIDAYSQGFEISSTAPAAVNSSGGTFIYLAIA